MQVATCRFPDRRYPVHKGREGYNPIFNLWIACFRPSNRCTGYCNDAGEDPA